MFKDIIYKIDILLKSQDDELRRELEEMGYVNMDETIDMINSVEDEFTYTFDNTLDLANSELNNGFDSNNLNEHILNIEYKEDFSELIRFMKDIFKSKINNFGQSYLKNIDKDLFFDTTTKYTSEFVNKWSKTLIKNVDDETLTGIKTILENGVNNGYSIEKMALNISESYELSRKRARIIALNETLRAHSYARNEASRQNPSVTKMMWRHSGTKGIKAREAHMNLDGTVINKNEYFNVNGHNAKFPRDIMLPPSESINCHCIAEEIIDEDILGLSLEERQQLQAEAIARLDEEYSEE